MKRFLCAMTAILLLLTSALSAQAITLPENTQTIEKEAFRGNSALTELVIPDGTLAIGDAAFADCTSLERVAVPDSVTSFGEGIFDGCDLTKLFIECSPISDAFDYAKAHGICVDPPKYRALLIGQMYPGTSNALTGPEADTKAMASALSRYSGTPYQITQKANLTKSGILSAISAAFADAQPRDVSLFYYSGHGFGLSGTRTGALVGTDGLGVTASDLRARLDTIPGKKIVIIDACFSGYLIGKSAAPAAFSLNSEAAVTADVITAFNNSFISAFATTARSIDNLADSSYYVITAATGKQISLEADAGNKYVGVFTYAFTEGLGWNEIDSTAYKSMPADDNNDGRISLAEGYSYAAKNAAEIAESLNAKDPQQAQVYPANCTDFFLVIK